jgi:membrane protein
VRRLHRRDLRTLAGRVLRHSMTDRVSLAAAGCAFYGTLALFPAISMLISVYGLMFDRTTVAPQLALLAEFLPAPAVALIEQRVYELIRQPAGTLSASLILGLLLTFWSASTGSKSLLSAVNVAYDVPEQRAFLHFHALGLAITLLAVVSAVLTLGVMLILRPAVGYLGMTNEGAGMVHMTSLLLLVAFFSVSIALLYRFGPSRPTPPRPVVAPGALLATMLWLLASESLSFYIANMSGFGAVYGSLGAVIAVMLWFYLAAYAVLLGAEVNARLETFEAGK